jgi:hypothetical protein
VNHGRGFSIRVPGLISSNQLLKVLKAGKHGYLAEEFLKGRTLIAQLEDGRAHRILTALARLVGVRSVEGEIGLV